MASTEIARNTVRSRSRILDGASAQSQLVDTSPNQVESLIDIEHIGAIRQQEAMNRSPPTQAEEHYAIPAKDALLSIYGNRFPHE